MSGRRGYTLFGIPQQKEVVVIMKKHDNNARNFANALSAYLEQGFLPGVRNFVHPDIVRGAEITMQRKIIQKQRPDATELFRRVEKDSRKDPNVDTYCKKFFEMDSRGLFEHVFLEEIMFAGRRFGDIDPAVVKDDVDKFVQLLFNIASRSPGEYTQLKHVGVAIQTHILLIARLETMAIGHEPYVKRVREAMESRCDSVYLAARGIKIHFIKPLTKSIVSNTTARHAWTRETHMWDEDGHEQTVSISLFRF